MALQKTIGSAFTAGFVGEIANDGPVRSKAARINQGVANSIARIGRAFTYDDGAGAELTLPGIAEATVKVGGVGKPFFGLLAGSKRYASQGASTGTLDPTLDRPVGSEAEFVDMGIMFAELTYLEDLTASKGTLSGAYGTPLWFVSGVQGTGDPKYIGALIGVIPNAADGAVASPNYLYAPVPNGKIINAVSYKGAMAAFDTVLTKVQLTN